MRCGTAIPTSRVPSSGTTRSAGRCSAAIGSSSFSPRSLWLPWVKRELMYALQQGWGCKIAERARGDCIVPASKPLPPHRDGRDGVILDVLCCNR